MPDPTPPNDLYGPSRVGETPRAEVDSSNPPIPEGQPEVVAPSPAHAIPVEETPEIIVEQPPEPATPPSSAPVPPAPKKKTPFWSTLGVLILFVGLFGLGVWLSSFVRQYFPGGLNGTTGQQQAVVSEPTRAPTDPFAGWRTYQVISGTTKLPIDGISYKLPADILAPICDATTCMSQGTYLTGGTRFTIAPRGVEQMLADFRGSAISDVGGVVFTTKDTTVSGHNAKLFTGSFGGKTVGGYGFSQMRGYMIEITPSLSLELNHFTPNGVTADFAADDTLFDQIVGTLVMPGTPSATPILTPATTIVPIATSTPVPATTSGY